MKTFSPFTFLFVCASLFQTSCSNDSNLQSGDKSSAKRLVNVDSLEKSWDDAWNSGNVNKVEEMLDKNALVFENEWIVSGRDSLLSKFVKPNMAVIKSFTTTKIMDNISDSIAFRVGHYQIALKDSTKPEHSGPFTLIWKKQSDGNWKVQVLQTGTDKN